VICLLGDFAVWSRGEAVSLRKESKLEALISALALEPTHSLSRDALSELLWQDVDHAYSVKSLHSLVYNLHKLLGVVGAVSFSGGYYRFSDQVGVDIAYFEEFANHGDRAIRRDNPEQAVAAFQAALDLYRGDLSVGSDLHAVLERERLRARYLSILAYLGDYHARRSTPETALAYAQVLLRADPCREDAHRLAMRCFLDLGERAQALRQYRMCELALHHEFGARPESATTRLFDQIRLGLAPPCQTMDAPGAAGGTDGPRRLTR
jgi:DNA-binding SARP family transcriptional activator